MIDEESFNRDLQRFEIEIMSEFETGLKGIKDELIHRETRLRNNMHSAIGGFLSYMRDRYGKPNGATE